METVVGTETMQVARLFGAGDLRLVEEPAPGPPPPDHSTVAVSAVGICGSDLHWFSEGAIGDARLTAPLALGHEMGGRALSGPYAGQRVAIDPAIPCEHCATCRAGDANLCPDVVFAGHGGCDGGLREIMTWPTRLLHPVPDELGDAAVAALEPLGVAIHAVDLSHLRLGATVAVVGCGPIGIFLIELARLCGAARVIAVEPLEHRRRAALEHGADEAHSPAADNAKIVAVQSVAHVVFEVSGSDAAVGAALDAARPGARVVLVGIPDGDLTTFTASTARRKGLTLVMSRRMGEVYPRAIHLAATSIDVASVVSDVFALQDVGQAFEHASARRGLKTVVSLWSSTT
ncbi:zinc-binding dehydrogenase [Lapillicoccus sp.]|uniref:zinc-dependent alcohol dehydrogenase n=1 Tax=Lapillicoccus sp. TaxID=1909287 RepID=UPI0025D41A7E|nr:zinc-binding dehydrogenase [Lapillicoccus sp.]